MNSRSLRGVVMAAVLWACAGAALAHHSFAAIWDETKTFSVTGVLQKVDWINPHSYVVVDVANKDGKVESYSFEGMPPGMLKRMGLSKDMLTAEVGKVVTVKAFPARDGTKTIGFGQSFAFKESGRNIVIVPEGTAAPQR